MQKLNKEKIHKTIRIQLFLKMGMRQLGSIEDGLEKELNFLFLEYKIPNCV